MAHLYALQGATASRSEAALLTATKEIISTQGIKNLAMIDIADLSQVSRATLYNHFRDKDAVLYSLLSREIIALFKGAPSSPTELLEYFSCAISADSALAGMRAHDRAILTTMLLRSDDKIWHAIDAFFRGQRHNIWISNLHSCTFEKDGAFNNSKRGLLLSDRDDPTSNFARGIGG